MTIRRWTCVLVPGLLLASSAFAAPKPLPPPLITIDQVDQLVRSQPIFSLEELLAKLPEKLRSRFTFIHTSRSRQGASFEFPRAILFGPDARFVLTFNGHPAQPNYNSIEMMEYDDRSARFRFATIELQSPAGARAFVNRDSSRCVGCHGPTQETLRPIWDPYPIWAGAYGGLDDNVLHGAGRSSRGRYSTNEEEKYVSFLQKARTQASHARYAALPFSSELRTAPYGNDRARDLWERPNFALTIGLMRLNARRVAREMVKAPAWSDRATRVKVARLLAHNDWALIGNEYQARVTAAMGAYQTRMKSSFAQVTLGSLTAGFLHSLKAAELLGLPTERIFTGRAGEGAPMNEGGAAEFEDYVLTRVIEELTDDEIPGMETVYGEDYGGADFAILGGSVLVYDRPEALREQDARWIVD
ncbi:MAG TPA: hypothetical protein VM598_01130 [Bdellovibrionota bacterium]|nr:hypothetical protein [Bdellovibrionota bacterium]